jgi:hypothetical protein
MPVLYCQLKKILVGSVLGSLKEYTLSLGHWGWIVAIDVVYSVTGLVLDVSRTTDFPTWAWLAPLIVALVVAPFIAFHRLRLKRDDLMSVLDVRRKRKEIADKLAEFYISGDEIKQEIIKDGFSGDARALYRSWSEPLTAYFRDNPDELGQARLLSLVPRDDGLTINKVDLGDEEREGVYYLFVIQLNNLVKLADEFVR